MLTPLFHNRSLFKPLTIFACSYKKSSKPIVIYGTSFCVFCNKAKSFLDKEGVPYDFINAENEPYTTEVIELKKRLNWDTVPLIYVKGNFVGGYTDLRDKVKHKEIDLSEFK